MIYTFLRQKLKVAVPHNTGKCCNANWILSKVDKLFEKHKIFCSNKNNIDGFIDNQKQLQADIDAAFGSQDPNLKDIFNINLDKCIEFKKKQIDIKEYNSKRFSSITKFIIPFVAGGIAFITFGEDKVWTGLVALGTAVIIAKDEYDTQGDIWKDKQELSILEKIKKN
jgi:hypothetical protein